MIRLRDLIAFNRWVCNCSDREWNDAIQLAAKVYHTLEARTSRGRLFEFWRRYVKEQT